MPNHTSDILIIFTRFPQPGTTKTRLGQQIGAEAAADCQRQMTEHIVAQARTLTQHQAIDLQIHYHGAEPGEMAAWLGDDLTYYHQANGDIGQRMAAGFSIAWQRRDAKVILIGSDCPDISYDILTTGFKILARADLVLGPAQDGGYYLIGMTRPHPELFNNIAWGTRQVMSQTLDIAADHKLIVKQVITLHDIDRPEDLKYFRNYTRP